MVVPRRDPLVALIRGAGIGVISATLGINAGFADMSSLAGRLAGLSYSREVERLADANGGVAYLQASGLRSDGLAVFFAMADALADKRGGSAGARISVGPSTDSRARRAQSRLAARRKRVECAAMGRGSRDVREAVTPATRRERPRESQCAQRVE
jgi:predicted Zn-dependent protease